MKKKQEKIEYATKQDLLDFEKRIDKKIANSEDRIIRHFDVVAENIHLDVASANKDKITLLDDKQKEHEERLTVLEEKAGLRA